MKKRNLFMSATLMCGLLCFAFTFNKAGIKWLWIGNIPVVVVLAIATLVLGVLWLKQARKLKN